MFVFDIITTLLIPVIMILGGLCMIKTAKGNPNGIVGYRTSLSMKNKETWEFANTYCGKLWVKFGIGFTAVTVLICVSYFFLDIDTVNVLSVVFVMIQTAMLVVTLVPVQRKLHSVFNNDGTRK